MDLKKHFATDADAEVEGVWHELGEGARIRVARAGNPRWREAFRQAARPYQNQLKRGTLPEETALEINIAIEAETVLVDWEGLEEGGKKLKYTPANAVRLLTEYPDFRRMVKDLADEMAHYRQDAAEEDAEDLGNG